MNFTETVSIKTLVEFLMLLFSLYILFQTILQRNINKSSNRFIMMIMIAFTIISALALMSSINVTISKYFIFLYAPAFIFLSPSTYLYIKSLSTKDYEFKAKDKRHYLIPLIVLASMFVVNVLLLILHFSGNKEATSIIVEIYFYMNAIVIIVVPIFQFFYYSIQIIRTYKKHLKDIENYFSNTEEAKIVWIRWFIIVYILFMLIFMLVNLKVAESTITDIFYYSEMLLFMAFLGVFGIKQADIYHQLSTQKVPVVDRITITTTPITDHEISPISSPVEIGTTQFVLADDKKEQLKFRLLELMEKEKPYLNSSLTINELADLMQTNQKYLSVVINDCFSKNFFSFINEYRVKEAIELLKTNIGAQYSIEGVGKSVGFHSRSTFISAFKKHTNFTPSEYKSA